MEDPYNPPPVPEIAPPAVSSAVMSSDEKMWATLAHLSALSGLFFPVVGNIAGPLIVYLVKKDTMPFVALEAKEALNFNISWAIWTTVLWTITIILMIVLVGFLLLPVAIIAHIGWVVLSIVGGLRANEGKPYRYPLTLRLVQ
ncbi:DUF4870 domain-containing protein [Luteolibacter sp. Populi]|uniref:DUF4870 domain-containing protein n=1 Tax=Luteolibacter sp. Populi TaxID=3230487 RepID=UPI003466EA7B